MINKQTSVCIVGGGPAGLMLGLLLVRRGVEVLVLEGHETFEREFGGKSCNPVRRTCSTNLDSCPIFLPNPTRC
jgi:2-polyprenyl-6-methoxyphenol hydroxylase-like FAD-dependent oxidoreductase